MCELCVGGIGVYGPLHPYGSGETNQNCGFEARAPQAVTHIWFISF